VTRGVAGVGLAGLPCGIGEGQNLAAYGVGCGWGHVTPEWVLRGTFRLTCANLLKRGQLRKKARRQGADQQPEVNAGELVDS